MPNTPNHQLPYVDDEDWLNQGAYALEQLAKRADAVLDGAGGALVIGFSDTNVTGGTSAGVIPFTGSVDAADDWTFDGSTATYTGASARTFMVSAEVTTQIEDTGSVRTSVEVRGNGTAFAGSTDYAGRNDAGTIRRDHTHRITVPVRLNPGDWIDVTGAGSIAYTIDSTRLRIYPIGPLA